MMCLELTMEDDDEEEKVPGKSAVKAKAATPKKQVAVKKLPRERSAFEDSDESDDVGLAPAKKAREEKPVQIDTSTIKLAAKTKKVAEPKAKP